MNNTDVLALLLSQAEREGSDLLTLRALVEEASQLGAQIMLARLGLDDDGAPDDLSQLRELLGAWRDAKASARRATRPRRPSRGRWPLWGQFHLSFPPSRE